MTNREAVIVKAVEDLFTDGQWKKALRLKLVFSPTERGTGWGKPAVTNKLRAVFDAGVAYAEGQCGEQIAAALNDHLERSCEFSLGIHVGASRGLDAGKPKWTAVQDKLPPRDSDDTYLTAVKSEYHSGYKTEMMDWINGQWACGDDSDIHAWTPLPEQYQNQGCTTHTFTEGFTKNEMTSDYYQRIKTNKEKL